MQPDQREVLDADQIEDLRGIDGGVFPRLVDMYVTKTPGRILLLRTHVEKNDFAAIAKEAHTIKGSSGSIGAARVANTCLRIEKACLAQDTAPFEELLRTLEGEFGRARDALRAILASDKPAGGG
jgi:HPt (histidine-containing phosphotransfer) domain-containing protein